MLRTGANRGPHRTPQTSLGTQPQSAEALSDLLCTGALTYRDAEVAVTALIALAGNDPDLTVQESALHAIAEAFDHYTPPLRLFHPIQRQAPTTKPDWTID